MYLSTCLPLPYRRVLAIQPKEWLGVFGMAESDIQNFADEKRVVAGIMRRDQLAIRVRNAVVKNWCAG